MPSYLYRLGRFAYRRRGLVTLVWGLILVAVALGAVTLGGPMSSSYSIPGTESQRAIDLLAERMPQSGADTASARVVFVADDGGHVTDQTQRTAIEQAVADIGSLPKVGSVVDPFTAQAVSADGTVAYATAIYTVEAFDLTDADRERLFAAGDRAESADLTVEFGGDAVQPETEEGIGEAIGLVVAAFVLVITFGALLAAGLPLLTAVVGISLGMLGIQLVAGLTELSDTTSTLALMLGLAVGIDYALFIVSRYRHELLLGRRPDDAIGRAVGTAGSAVVFAGATVVIALTALWVAGIPFLTEMGVGAAATVAVAVLVALTLLPALLGFVGPRVLGRRGRAARDTETDGGAPPLGERWARTVVRHRVPVLLVAVVGLGAVAIPAADVHLAMPSDGTAAPDSTQRRAYDALAEGFGPGFNGPLLVAADLTGAADPAAAAQAIETDLQTVSGVVGVSPATLNAAGDTAILEVIPETGPEDPATEDLVHDIRGQAESWQADTGADIYVTGTTAAGIDISEKLSDAMVPYLAVVVGLAFLLLMLVFRSLLVPLKATLGFLLSIFATMGAVVAVFQHGWFADLVGLDAPGPILSFLPILVVGILFGLAMDYEVFLVTRTREEHVHGAGPDDAVVLGFRHGARVVTAAAIIMVSVFAGFVTSDDSIVKSIGFALAFGVLVDAFVVRMTIVPAVLSLLGDRAWSLPRWLDRLLPDVDVEGEKLTRLLEQQSDRKVADPSSAAGRPGPR